MQFPTRKTRTTRLDPAIEELLEELKGFEGNDDNYKLTTEQLEKLYALRDQELPKTVSPDTCVIVGGNLAIATLILWFERSSVVTTKLTGFLSKLR